MRTDSVHVFLVDGAYHDSCRHGTTASLLNHEWRVKGASPQEVYSFSDLTGMWSHHRPSTKKPNTFRWVLIAYKDVPAEIKAQMMLLCSDCNTDGQKPNPFKTRQ